ASYHCSKSARDRDRLREEVLNRLGWDLYRIWTTDWFRDPLACRELLKEYLDERLSEAIEAIPEGYVHPAELDAKTPASPDKDTESITGTETEVHQARDTQDDDPYIKIGTKFSLRYLDGPRAGAVAKFWFQQQTNDPRYHLDGYTTVGNDSPLGEALEGAEVGEMSSYPHGNQEVRVEVLEIEIT
ncbi:hypothetical protein, partial [Porticoccus sp.]|uniref:hypothetical protein n=1 Tax=Porticoccus sp. TaxID=2024853 RepID=UPI003F69B370